MINKYRNTIVLTCILGLFACNNNSTKVAEPIPVELANIHQHIKTLASDSYEGRGPLTLGEDLTIKYIAKEYQKLGLKGGYKGEFFEPVPLAKITPDNAMKLNIDGLELIVAEDFTARTEHLSEKIQLNNSDVVFVGYGINAPEYNWNDYAGIDVKDKTVIMLVNDPGFATQNDDLFTGNAMTYYGRWTYKWEEAARQGAKAAFIIHETAPAAYPWSVVLAGNTGSMYALVDNEKNKSRLPILGWLQTSAANKIFSKIGSSYLKEKELALSQSFKSRSLNLKANLNLSNKLEQAESNNVVALLEGSMYPDEYIVISAHWDHFGKQITDNGVKILNGAIDNASGVAGTIELARMLVAQHAIKPFERSIVFANFTAEETGLLGSAMFAQGGSVPMSQVVSVLNIDGMNTLDGVGYILQYGQNMSEMEDYLAKFSAKQNRRVKLDPRPQNGLFFRSDHFSFAKQGVPGLLFMSLGDTDPDYIPFKYHKEADDYSPAWSLGGVKQDLELIQSIAIELANNRDWPKWTSESDFKKRRAEDGK